MSSEFHFYKKKKKIDREKIKIVLVTLVEMAVMVVLAAILVYFMGIQTKVTGQSMEPGIRNGDTVWLNRFVYMLSSPKRGDVIAYYPNGNKDASLSIKRVIAVPGDTVCIDNGIVYVNGEAVKENYDASIIKEAGLASEELIIGQDEYFVLGDNRGNSEDSRHANIGNVLKDEIVGKVWLRGTSFRDINLL